MSHRRRATCDSEHLTTTPSKRSRIDRGHAAHFPRPKYKPHVDSGIGKNFHSLRYPLSLLPYRSWAALNNGEVSGGVCPQCGKDRDATPYQRKLFLVAERLSWGSGTTSRQQKEQNEVALWAVNADLDVFEPAVEDDEVIMGGRHSRENKWYPFRDQLEADLALKIVEKANILSEASWKVWKDVTLLRQTGRKPLGELGSSSSQSPRWSSRKNKRDAGTASDSSMPKTLFSDPPLEDVAIMKCSYETLSDFYSILDKIEKTSPVAARYLEAYAERLHVDACKSCWFKNTIVDLPDEGQAVGSLESLRLAGGAGLPPTGALAVSPDTQPSAIGSCVYSNSHLLQGPNFSKRSVSLHHGHSSRGPAGPGHVLAPRPWAQLPPSRAPLVAAAAAAPVPQQRQATEWLQRHFSVDATTHTTMNVLWQTYRDTFPGVPRLGYAEFVDRVLETFAASKLLPLGDGTFMVQGVRQNVTIGEAQSSHSTNQNRGSHNMLSLVPATHAKEESLFEWLRRTYEPYQYAEVSATQLIEAYRSDFGRSPWASLPLLDVSKEIPGSRSSLRNGKVIYFNLRRKSNCHAAAPDSQQAQHGATTSASAGTQDGVAALEEPMRSAQWLRCHYIADPDSEVPQQALFAAYRERFGTSQKLNGVEFLDSVERTFPTTSRGRNAAQDYVIKGLMPKPSDVSIKQRTPITSQPRLPQADSGLSSTTEGKLTVLVEARDKPPVYVKVSPATTISHIVNGMKKWMNLPIDQPANLCFGGVRLSPESRVEDTDLEDMDSVDLILGGSLRADKVESCKTWLRKQYIADESAPRIRSASIWLSYRSACHSCTIPAAERSICPEKADFEKLILEVYPSATLHRSVSGANIIKGVKSRWPSFEPARTSAWLKTNLMADRLATTPKSKIWQAYRDDFAPPNSEVPILSHRELCMKISKDFPDLSSAYGGSGQDFRVVKGIRIKTQDERESA